MNSTMKVTGVVIFGVLMSFTLPHLINLNTNRSFETENQRETQTEATTSSSNEVAIAPTPKDESGTPIEQSDPVQEETPVQEAPVQEVAPEPEPQAEPIVYDGMTLNELAEKLERSLKSTLDGTGMSFAKYAVDMGIDPYLAVAIVLHETGCNYKCSAQVRECYNVGGMKGGPSCNGTSYKKFNSLDDGIYSFMANLKENYYDHGLTTPELMNKKYAASKTWATKVNNYISKIKAA